MKANELMIGDWVFIDRPDKYAGAKAQIKTLIFHKEDDGQYFSVFIHNELGIVRREVFNEDLRPIPLTAKILEKNGFIKNKSGQWVIEKKHSIGCGGQTCSNTNPLEYAVGWDEFGLGCVSYLEKEGSITLVGTTYVHQLQQILRLFDLDKFIKIEL